MWAMFHRWYGIWEDICSSKIAPRFLTVVLEARVTTGWKTQDSGVKYERQGATWVQGEGLSQITNNNLANNKKVQYIWVPTYASQPVGGDHERTSWLIVKSRAVMFSLPSWWKVLLVPLGLVVPATLVSCSGNKGGWKGNIPVAKLNREIWAYSIQGRWVDQKMRESFMQDSMASRSGRERL